MSNICDGKRRFIRQRHDSTNCREVEKNLILLAIPVKLIIFQGTFQREKNISSINKELYILRSL